MMQMTNLLSILLNHFEGRDEELLLKAKFLMLIILCGLGILALSLVYTALWTGADTLVMYAQVSGFCILFLALWLLVRGHYRIAVHTMFCTAFGVCWVILFTEPADSLIIKLDTIVFVVGVMAAMPVLLLNNRVPIAVYSLSNIAIFTVFTIVLRQTTDIAFPDIVDYFMDNLLVMIFVFLVAMNAFTIFRQALGSLRKELAERIEVEKKLKQAMVQAEAGARAKMEFLTNMSHEIRTPINGIMGMAEIAREANQDPHLDGIVRTIETEADQLLGIINQILDFSKLEAGKLIIETLGFNLRETFDQACASLAMGFNHKRLDFKAFLSPEIPDVVLGDPGRLRQVIMNLAGNAFKFTRQGEVFVRADLVDQTETRVKVRFSVKDTGVGIPEAKLAEIFEGFSQADGSTTRQYGGTGLGTTISKQLLELMGGTIGVESREGEGSEFWFVLSFDKVVQDSPAQSLENTVPGQTKVLVISACPDCQEIFKAYLNVLGCRVIQAQSRPEGERLLREEDDRQDPVALVLMDCGQADLGLAGADRASRERKRFVLLPATARDGAGEIYIPETNAYGMASPVALALLKTAILRVLGQADDREKRSADRSDQAPEPTGTENEDRKVHGPEEGNHPGIDPAKAKILLVEDYPTNQRIAAQHLTRAGYEVTLAENGEAAVAQFKRNEFQLVLMDIQMPVMDGYEATRRIREIEAQIPGRQDGSPVPVVAMTAHAVTGYREKCLAAGMDDYLTKPLKRDHFLSVVAKWCGQKSSTRMTPINSMDAPLKEAIPVVPLDYQKALVEFEHDHLFLGEVVREFIETAAEQIPRIAEAVAQDRFDIVSGEAHAIKGGAANLRAAPLSRAAEKLQAAAEARQPDLCRSAIGQLRSDFSRLKTYLHSLENKV